MDDRCLDVNIGGYITSKAPDIGRSHPEILCVQGKARYRIIIRTNSKCGQRVMRVQGTLTVGSTQQEHSSLALQ